MNIFQVAPHAEDLGRAAEFYTRLTGSGPTGRFEPPGLLFFDLGGVRLLLEQGTLSSTPYLKVDSVDDSLGPAGMVEWQGFIRDSEGNLVGLVSLEPPDLANVEESLS